MTPLEFINEKLAICEKATPGPWKWDRTDVFRYADEDPIQYKALLSGKEKILSSCDCCPVMDDGPDAGLIADAGANYAKVLRALKVAVEALEHVEDITRNSSRIGGKEPVECLTCEEVNANASGALAAMEKELR